MRKPCWNCESLSQAYSKKKEEDEQERLDAKRKESVVTPRTILITTQDDNDVYPVANRDFDGRALDPSEYITVCAFHIGWRSRH